MHAQQNIKKLVGIFLSKFITMHGPENVKFFIPPSQSGNDTYQLPWHQQNIKELVDIF